MIKEIFNYCMIFSVLIGIVFIIKTLLSEEGKDKTIIYLNLVVVFFTLNNLQIVLIDNIFTSANFFIRNLLLPFYALIVPAFYTFLSFYLNIETKITSFVKFCSMFFILELTVRLFLFPFFYNDSQNFIVAQYSQIEEIANALFSLFLFGKSFIIVFKNPKIYSFVLSFDTIKWIKKFLYLGTIIMLTWIFAIFFNLDKVLNPKIFIYYPLRLSSSILLFWIGFQGVFNYKLMSERILLRKALAFDKKIKNNINLKKDKFIMIKNHIEQNNRYLDCNFSLETLAEELNIGTSSLSQTINQNSNYNFSDYINSLRVEKVKTILINKEYKNYTITAIGLECGFNSKSTFYSAFKKFTNTTPSDYKKLHY